jgi:hypothetical protein
MERDKTLEQIEEMARQYLDFREHAEAVKGNKPNLARHWAARADEVFRAAVRLGTLTVFSDAVRRAKKMRMMPAIEEDDFYTVYESNGVRFEADRYGRIHWVDPTAEFADNTLDTLVDAGLLTKTNNGPNTFGHTDYFIAD